MIEKDPFTKVYECLWALLEASEDFCAMVPKSHRVKYVDDYTVSPPRPAMRFPEIEARQKDGYPIVIIEPTGAPTDMNCSSDASRVHETFQIWIKTGDRRLSYTQDGRLQGLFPLQWTILQAMAKWVEPMKLLTWKDRAGFVFHCSVSNRKTTIESPRTEEQKSPVKDKGWSLAWQGDVEMWFPSDDIEGV